MRMRMIVAMIMITITIILVAIKNKITYQLFLSTLYYMIYKYIIIYIYFSGSACHEIVLYISFTARSIGCEDRLQDIRHKSTQFDKDIQFDKHYFRICEIIISELNLMHRDKKKRDS